jgi:hypothetical protein
MLKSKKITRKYDDMYLRILEIGQSKLETGLTFTELENQLISEGYDIQNNDCIELPVKKWFLESFDNFTLEDGEICETVDHVSNYKDRNCVLKGSHCLILLEHQTSKNNLFIARTAICISVIAAIFQIIDIFLSRTI